MEQANRLERILLDALTITGDMDELIIFDALKSDSDQIIDLALKKLDTTVNPMLLGVQVVNTLLTDDLPSLLHAVEKLDTEKSNTEKIKTKAARLSAFESGMFESIQDALKTHHPAADPSARDVGDSATMVFCITVAALVLEIAGGLKGVSNE